MSEDLDKLRAIAGMGFRRTHAAYEYYNEQHVSFRKWMLGALLSVNVAAIATVWSVDGLEPFAKACASLWAAAGIFVILAFGIAESIVLNKLGALYYVASGRFEKLTLVEQLEQVGDLGEARIDQLIKIDACLGWLPIGSLGCLLICAGIVVDGLL